MVLSYKIKMKIQTAVNLKKMKVIGKVALWQKKRQLKII